MGKKHQEPKKEEKEMTAPFFMLTYGDMVTLLMGCFVILFSLAAVESSKYAAQVSIMQGAMGISKMHDHAPMAQNLPAPAVKKSTETVAHLTKVPSASDGKKDDSPPQAMGVGGERSEALNTVQAIGLQNGLKVETTEDELTIILPLYGIFDKGDYQIDSHSPDVQRCQALYTALAKQIAILSCYDISFVGHTDTLPFVPNKEGRGGPRNNMELGFTRAIAVYEYFFAPYLQDRTRILFASQGDNIPLITNASLDAEHTKNRRVEIHLKKR